jgi:hypothetical protein
MRQDSTAHWTADSKYPAPFSQPGRSQPGQSGKRRLSGQRRGNQTNGRRASKPLTSSELPLWAYSAAHDTPLRLTNFSWLANAAVASVQARSVKFFFSVSSLDLEAHCRASSAYRRNSSASVMTRALFRDAFIGIFLVMRLPAPEPKICIGLLTRAVLHPFHPRRSLLKLRDAPQYREHETQTFPFACDFAFGGERHLSTDRKDIFDARRIYDARPIRPMGTGLA